VITDAGAGDDLLARLRAAGLRVLVAGAEAAPREQSDESPIRETRRKPRREQR